MSRGGWYPGKLIDRIFGGEIRPQIVEDERKKYLDAAAEALTRWGSSYTRFIDRVHKSRVSAGVANSRVSIANKHDQEYNLGIGVKPLKDYAEEVWLKAKDLEETLRKVESIDFDSTIFDKLLQLARDDPSLSERLEYFRKNLKTNIHYALYPPPPG